MECSKEVKRYIYMNFTQEQLWSRVIELEGTIIRTISRDKPNKILEVTDNEVIIADRTTRPTKDDLYSTYVLLDSLDVVTTEDITWLKEKRVSRICLAIIAEAAKDEITVVKDGRRSGIAQKRIS